MASEERKALEKLILEKLGLIRGRLDPRTLAAMRAVVSPDAGAAVPAAPPPADPQRAAAARVYRANRVR
jgi:hypothetical protein